MRGWNTEGDETDNSTSKVQIQVYIPDICHFFYTDKIFGEKNLYRKNGYTLSGKGGYHCKNNTFSKDSTYCVNHTPFCNTKQNYFTVKCQFFEFNLEKITPDRKNLHRHVCGVCDKYQVWEKCPCTNGHVA